VEREVHRLGLVFASRQSVASLLALSLASCIPAAPQAPTNPSDDPAFAAADLTPKGGLDEEGGGGEDVLCPGDVVALKTFGPFETTPSGGGVSVDTAAVLVQRTGGIHLALLGDVQVGGLSLQDAEARVQTRLSTLDRVGRVSLTMVDPRGHVATVVGAVEHAGTFPLIGDARFLDVLAASGGAKTFQADGKYVAIGNVEGASIIRGGVQLPTDARLALEGDPRHNVRIHPNDVIVVPPTLEGRIAVIGHVGSQKTLVFHSHYHLLEALADAGGLAIDADLEDVRILRGGLKSPKVFVANARDVLAGRRPDVLLAPGDVIFVTEHWTGTLGRLLDRGVPLLAGVFYAQSVTSSVNH
jgi:polysaccharide export outer membrane protein